jgi:hypothetical protein
MKGNLPTRVAYWVVRETGCVGVSRAIAGGKNLDVYIVVEDVATDGLGEAGKR